MINCYIIYHDVFILKIHRDFKRKNFNRFLQKMFLLQHKLQLQPQIKLVTIHTKCDWLKFQHVRTSTRLTNHHRFVCEFMKRQESGKTKQ